MQCIVAARSAVATRHCCGMQCCSPHTLLPHTYIVATYIVVAACSAAAHIHCCSSQCCCSMQQLQQLHCCSPWSCATGDVSPGAPHSILDTEPTLACMHAHRTHFRAIEPLIFFPVLLPPRGSKQPRGRTEQGERHHRRIAQQAREQGCGAAATREGPRVCPALARRYEWRQRRCCGFK